MKRFLIPFLALAVTACGNNDIVVTSEVGEKLIVERDTIQLQSTSKDDESTKKLLEVGLRLKNMYCDRNGYVYNADDCQEYKDKNAAREHTLELNKGPIWTQSFRYLPVHRDRNGIETVQKEKFATCVHPELSDESKEILAKDKFNEILMNKNDGALLVNSVARTICKEYAKWEELQ